MAIGHGTRHGVVVVVALALGTVAGLVWFWGGLRPGPLKPPPNATTNGASVATGAAVTWGGAYLRNDSPDPVILRQVRVIGGDDGGGARVERVEVLDPATVDAGVGVGAGDAYEDIPASLRHRVDGYRIEPGRYVNILVKVSATRPGVWRYEALDVVYSAGPSRHTVQLPQSFVLCVGHGQRLHREDPRGQLSGGLKVVRGVGVAVMVVGVVLISYPAGAGDPHPVA